MSKGGGGSEKQQSVVNIQGPMQYGPYSENMLKRLYGYSQGLLDQPLTPTQVELIKKQRNLANQGGQLLGPATGGVKGIMQRGGFGGPGTQGFAQNLMGGQYVNPATGGNQVSRQPRRRQSSHGGSPGDCQSRHRQSCDGRLPGHGRGAGPH